MPDMVVGSCGECTRLENGEEGGLCVVEFASNDDDFERRRCLITARGTGGASFHPSLRVEVSCPLPLGDEENDGPRPAATHVTWAQPLPRGAYMDMDELRRIARGEGGFPSAVADAPIDVEMSATRASPRTVLFTAPIDCEESTMCKSSWELPLHLRYHAPGAANSKVTVSVPSEMWLHSDGRHPTIHRSSPPCKSDVAAAAFDVPTGNIDDATLVIIATLMSILAAATILIRSRK